MSSDRSYTASTRSPRIEDRPQRIATPGRITAAGLLTVLALGGLSPASAATDTGALERRVAELEAELAQAERDLAAARAEAAAASDKAAAAAAELEASDSAEAKKITVGPLTIGGAMRANYLIGSYPGEGNGGPSRGGDGGTFALDTFRINLDLKYESLIGK
ncbi:MAG: hypothetical protein PVH47_04200, partial [Thiohalocapsa sp.]